jgi:hypothetical protein
MINRYPFTPAAGSADAWSRCEIETCEWHVPADTVPRRCHYHGGKPVAARMTDAWGVSTWSYAGGDAETDRG